MTPGCGSSRKAWALLLPGLGSTHFRDLEWLLPRESIFQLSLLRMPSPPQNILDLLPHSSPSWKRKFSWLVSGLHRISFLYFSPRILVLAHSLDCGFQSRLCRVILEILKVPMLSPIPDLLKKNLWWWGPGSRLKDETVLIRGNEWVKATALAANSVRMSSLQRKHGAFLCLVLFLSS